MSRFPRVLFMESNDLGPPSICCQLVIIGNIFKGLSHIHLVIRVFFSFMLMVVGGFSQSLHGVALQPCFLFLGLQYFSQFIHSDFLELFKGFMLMFKLLCGFLFFFVGYHPSLFLHVVDQILSCEITGEDFQTKEVIQV